MSVWKQITAKSVWEQITAHLGTYNLQEEDFARLCSELGLEYGLHDGPIPHLAFSLNPKEVEKFGFDFKKYGRAVKRIDAEVLGLLVMDIDSLHGLLRAVRYELLGCCLDRQYRETHDE